MKPTPDQTADCLAQIEQLTDRLRALEPAIRARATTSDRDGYPRSSLPGGDHGTGDPVGNLVALRIDHPDRNTPAHAHAQLLTKLHQARRLLEQAESAGKRALPTVKVIGDDGCNSCARIKMWSPISRARRCRWCSDWANAHQGNDPPISILHAHHDGRRITTRLTDALTRRRRT